MIVKFLKSSIIEHKRTPRYRPMNKNYIYGLLGKWYSQLILKKSAFPTLCLQNTLMAVGCHGQHLLLVSHCLASFMLERSESFGFWCNFTSWSKHLNTEKLLYILMWVQKKKKNSDERYSQLVLPIPIFWKFCFVRTSCISNTRDPEWAELKWHSCLSVVTGA